MNVCSVPFLLSCGVSSVLAGLIPGKAYRRAFLAAINLGFLYLVVPNKRSWAVLGAFIGATYLALRLVRGLSARSAVGWIIVVAVALFAYLKQYTVLGWVVPAGWMPRAVEVVGLSYMLFKFIHMLIDQSQGQLDPFTLASYANYQLSFFTLLAGPIQRYNDFRRDWDDFDPGAVDADETLRAWDRILNGMVKVGALAPIAWYFFEDGRILQAEPTNRVAVRFLECFYAYPIFMYFNFSGYTDVVIGAARLLGFRLPENFDRPYLARNVIDYWNRWHMTLSHWIRDYIFMTWYKAGVERFPKAAAPLGYLLLFLSLFISGVWHGSTPRFAAFGVVHGLGAACNQAYADALRRRLGRERMKRYQKSWPIHAIATFVTFHYVCFAFLFFSMGTLGAWSVVKALARRVLALGWIGLIHLLGWSTLLATSAAVALLLAVRYRGPLLAGLGRLGRWVALGTSGLHRLVLVKTALVVVLLLTLWALERGDPIVVYERF